MPQPLNAQPGSQLASAAPDGFETLDQYDKSLQADAAENAVEIPDDLLIPTEGEEAPAEGEESTAPEGEEAAPEDEKGAEAPEGDETFSVELDGRTFSSDDISQLLAERQRVTEVFDEYTALKEDEGKAGDLSELRELKSFFDKNPDIRRKLESEVGEFKQLADKNLSDDPHVRAMQKEMAEMRADRKEEKVRQSEAEIDKMFGTLEEKYPDIINSEFRQVAMKQVYGAFKGDPRFGNQAMSAVAKGLAFLMDKATKTANQNGKDATVRALKKPGIVRLVPPGKRADAKPNAVDYTKMSDQEVQDAFVKEMAQGE